MTLPILPPLIITSLSSPVPGVSAEERKDSGAENKYDRMEKPAAQASHDIPNPADSWKNESGASNGSSSTPQSIPNSSNFNLNLPD
jgi:hypothetical protein